MCKWKKNSKFIKMLAFFFKTFLSIINNGFWQFFLQLHNQIHNGDIRLSFSLFHFDSIRQFIYKQNT